MKLSQLIYSLCHLRDRLPKSGDVAVDAKFSSDPDVVVLVNNDDGRGTFSIESLEAVAIIAPDKATALKVTISVGDYVQS